MFSFFQKRGSLCEKIGCTGKLLRGYYHWLLAIRNFWSISNLDVQMSSRNSKLHPGKLPHEILARILADEPVNDPRVIAGPAVGWDAAVLDFGDKYLIAKTDPITYATSEIGWFAVHINANDIACMGGTPRWFLASLLMPGGDSDEMLVEHIFSDIRKGCAEIGVNLIGGHTEITQELTRPVVAGVMLGEVERNQLITPDGVKAGDVLVLTKGIPLEAVSIMARERKEELVKVFGKERVETASKFLYEPGISVVKDARIACQAVSVHAMHDPTEGGLATAVNEISQAAGLDVLLDGDAIPVLEEGRLFCKHFDMDPLGSFASGALLICVDPSEADQLLVALKDEGLAAEVIGEMRIGKGQVMIRRGGREEPIRIFNMDEIGKIF